MTHERQAQIAYWNTTAAAANDRVLLGFDAMGNLVIASNFFPVDDHRIIAYSGVPQLYSLDDAGVFIRMLIGSYEVAPNPIRKDLKLLREELEKVTEAKKLRHKHGLVP